MLKRNKKLNLLCSTKQMFVPMLQKTPNVFNMSKVIIAEYG